VRILKSMPIVVMKEGVKESSEKRSRQQDFPTPESPIRRSLICGVVGGQKKMMAESEVETVAVKRNVRGNHNSECQPYWLLV
jgi:hypothetical protein